MTVTLDELIRQILKLYDDLPGDRDRETIYRRIFGSKEDDTDGQKKDGSAGSQSPQGRQSGV